MHFDGFATIADPNISFLTSEFQGGTGREWIPDFADRAIFDDYTCVTSG